MYSLPPPLHTTQIPAARTGLSGLLLVVFIASADY